MSTVAALWRLMRPYQWVKNGFVLVGLWTETSWNVLPWAVYCASWLAIEAAGLGARLTRVPRVLRHVYVLLVVLLGWVLLRASGPGPLLGYLEAMVGASVAPFGASAEYFTLGFSTALVSALIFAGPLVGNLIRRLGGRVAADDVRRDRHPALARGERRAPALRTGSGNDGQPPQAVNRRLDSAGGLGV